ncbi:hypothetical protein HL657_07785 [Methanoculleus sp. YWC-01]|jgi:hypothetical protein|uniref:Uncharacterized protein n=1 Tax=Methanoculleus nereidis TaxID=2735141 RepID=A0ABU3Z2M6_9EURY|nr:hypothetical protein [Methanoculleus sp. YWC-01]MCK9299428.1 hypothetical protein [Methanoculleus sp.]MDV4343071.1 hypothetical protein [Methanoculleus sp. YWC-01]
MVVLQPGKKWDAQDQRERRGPPLDIESGRSPGETWETRDMSVRYPLNEIVAEKTREWLSTPELRPWHINRSIDNATLPVSALSREIEELRQIVQELRESNSALQSRVSALERKLIKETTADNLWEISDNNLLALEEISGIATPPDRPGGQDPFDALKGLLIEYSDETVDSAELVKSVRGK